MSGLPADIETVHTQETDCTKCGGKNFYKVILEKLFFHIEKEKLFGEPTGEVAWICISCGHPKK